MADTFSESTSLSSSQDAHDGAEPSRSTSRGRSFSLFRKPSKDGLVPTRSTSLGRKLVRRRSSKEQSPIDSQPPPRLPSTILETIPGSLPHDTATPATLPPQHQNYSRSSPGAYQRHRMAPSHKGFVPVPPIPEASSPPTTSYNTSQKFDPHARAESMTNRGRFSYSSTATVQHSGSPRRMRRRKDPTPFNVLVVGTKGSGKTSFINFLRTALAASVKKRPTTPSAEPPTSSTDTSGPFLSHYLETEIEGERIGLTLYDSKGLERHLVDLQLREMSSFLESKFQETFNEEQKVMRATGVRDTHVHCVLLVLDPSRLDANLAASKAKAQGKYNVEAAAARVVGGLDEDLDIEVIQKLEGKTTIIPIISKADTITTAHMAHLKRSVWDSLKKIKFDPLEALDIAGDDIEEEDEESDETDTNEKDNSFPEDDSSNSTPKGDCSREREPKRTTKQNNLAPPMPPTLSNADVRFSVMSINVDLPDIPMSIISPDEYDPGIIGRRFPWGFADPYNADHCDFVRLKETVFSEWRTELRDVSREKWYEGWRTNRLNKRGPTRSSASTLPAGITIPNRGTRMSNTANSTSPHNESQNLALQIPLSPTAAQRTVSSAAAYGSMTGRQSSSKIAPQQRTVSASEIGVAIGGDSPIEPRMSATWQPTQTTSEYMGTNGYAS